jgi:signal transduction histidine kinase
MEGAEAALDAVEDLEFFLGPPPAGEAETRNLMELIHEVTREFASQSSVLLKVSGPQEPVRVRVRAEALMDALFLVLHNAGEFGGGAPVRVSVVRREGMASVLVRDQGPGFTPEAMQRAFEPLYSTSPGGLGLGLPHARQVVRDQGGDIELRNLEGGGAEVEILIPEMAP